MMWEMIYPLILFDVIFHQGDKLIHPLKILGEYSILGYLLAKRCCILSKTYTFQY